MQVSYKKRFIVYTIIIGMLCLLTVGLNIRKNEVYKTTDNNEINSNVNTNNDYVSDEAKVIFATISDTNTLEVEVTDSSDTKALDLDY